MGPYQFHFWTTQSAKIKCTVELEFLAVVWSMYPFRHYLYGNHFQLITDHKALLGALNNNRGNRCYQSRLVMWVEMLLPFDFMVSLLPGSKLGLTDYLSRDTSGHLERPTNYNEKFVVASAEGFLKSCNKIKSLN